MPYPKEGNGRRAKLLKIWRELVATIGIQIRIQRISIILTWTGMFEPCAMWVAFWCICGVLKAAATAAAAAAADATVGRPGLGASPSSWGVIGCCCSVFIIATSSLPWSWLPKSECCCCTCCWNDCCCKCCCCCWCCTWLERSCWLCCCCDCCSWWLELSLWTWGCKLLPLPCEICLPENWPLGFGAGFPVFSHKTKSIR